MEASSLNTVQTAAELRRQLHMMKARDREALAETGSGTLSRDFLKTHWFTALATGAGVFLTLLATNPLFVQSTDAKPDMRKIGSWALLAALIVALGPLLFQKFLAK